MITGARTSCKWVHQQARIAMGTMINIGKSLDGWKELWTMGMTTENSIDEERQQRTRMVMNERL